MKSQDFVNNLYGDASLWKESKTMEHASGIWGRKPTLKYLKEKIILPGDIVVDLGAGAGYPSLQMIPMVGQKGRVIGIELSDAMLAEAEKYQEVENLEFRKGDITQILPMPDNSADVVTSFMVCHNLPLQDMRAIFANTARLLRPGAKAVFLTMHPDALESERWGLDFMVYDSTALQMYQEAKDKEDVQVPGVVKNAGGGSKRVFMFNHTRKNTLQAIRDAGLMLVNEIALWIDEDTAKSTFGAKAVRKLPTTPTFVIMVLEK